MRVSASLAGRRVRAAVGALAVAAGLVLCALLDPGSIEGLPTLCPFRRVTGLDCPGCGMTRALSALLHGDPDAAAAHHPLVLVALPLAVGALLWLFAEALSPRPLTARVPRPVRTIAALVLLAAFVAVWVARLVTPT